MDQWQQIVARHSGSTFETAYRLLGDAADAGDCMQEAFVAAVKLSRRQEVRNWPGLLNRLAAARAIDMLRRRTRNDALLRQAAQQGPSRGGDGPLQQAQQQEQAQRLREAIARIPPRQAQAFVLRFMNDHSYEEIAELLEASPSAVAMLIQRAKAALAAILGRDSMTGDGP